jgi:uncharacterized protein (UPF0332 family)
MTWLAMARENLVAAKSLLTDARWRSAVSRAYYAAYGEVTGKLEDKVSFPAGLYGPSHDNLPKLILNSLSAISLAERRRIKLAAIRLYRQRIAADYRPGEYVGAEEAGIAVRDASFIFRTLEHAED